MRKSGNKRKGIERNENKLKEREKKWKQMKIKWKELERNGEGEYRKK